MVVQYTPLILPLLLAAGVTGALGVYAWRHRRGRGGVVPFALLMFGTTWWTICGTLQWASANLAAQYLWLQCSWLAIPAVPVVWLTFAVDYTRRRRLDRRTIALLCVIPAISTVLALTNDWHHLLWRSVESAGGGSSVFRLSALHGPWYVYHLAYSYLLMLVGTVLILSALVRSPERYRGQATGLIVAVVAPWAMNVVFQTGLVSTGNIDPTPFAFTITGAAMAWSIFRYRLLNIVPLAHDAVVRSLRDPVIVLDARQHVADINPSAARLLGRTVDEVVDELGKTVLFEWPDVVAQLTGGTDGETEVSLPSDGSSRPYTLRLSTLLDRSGRPSGRLLHLQDIEKHKQTEAALHETEESFYAIVESMRADAYFESNRAGIIGYANRAFCDAIGYPKAEVVGAHFAKFIAPESAEALAQYFRSAYHGNATQQPHEYQFRRRDGSLGVGEVTISLVQVKDGHPVGARGIVRDVTQRKRAEEALQRAKDAAEEASQAKSTFLTNVSHELRTPLTSVLGFAKVIQKRFAEQITPNVNVQDPKTERAVRQVTENLAVVVTEGERLTRLINDVLDLSKIESGQVEWQRQSVVVAELIERARAAIVPASEQKGVRLTIDIEPALPSLVGDPERLTQALVNLLSNAVKFTAPGGSITCTARRASDEIVLSVSDTGIGIAPADCAKVFEHFVQVGDTLTDKPTGTGLGLPICKQIIEHHGGRIWVESAIGKGSTFAFTLPINGAAKGGGR
ncbi:MAG: PAS domain S-box protein [Deltaproteobacteria bacterium]|nr:PAS domain S-box protein [Deltaproteobacteria bacterium]MBI3388355.1 PAS domain S-box protein [Deltaproteobacteria bacterium]